MTPFGCAWRNAKAGFIGPGSWSRPPLVGSARLAETFVVPQGQLAKQREVI